MMKAKQEIGDGLSVVTDGVSIGKSLLALDLAFHVAAGQAWHGYPVRGGRVVFVAGAAGRGLTRRIEAMRCSRPELIAEVGDRLAVLPLSLNLSAPGHAGALIEAVKKTAPALIVFDGLVRMGGDMRRAVEALHHIRTATGAHVMALHHDCPEALRRAADRVIELAHWEGQIEVRQRGATPLRFRLRTVPIGMDEDGEPVTSVVLDPADLEPMVGVLGEPALAERGSAFALCGPIRTLSLRVPASETGVKNFVFGFSLYAAEKDVTSETNQEQTSVATPNDFASCQNLFGRFWRKLLGRNRRCDSHCNHENFGQGQLLHLPIPPCSISLARLP